MLKSISKKLIVGLCTALIAVGCFVPSQKVHASSAGTAAAIFSGVAGAMIGAGLQRAADRKHHHSDRVYYRCVPRGGYQGGGCPAAVHQKYLMKQVLANYNPAFHNMWVEYVMIDLMDQLTPMQQNQLIRMMEQRRSGGCPMPIPYAA